ncbi:hypothetical protein ABZU76_38350 [Amycolatopsis sp. NPDC005232]
MDLDVAEVFDCVGDSSQQPCDVALSWPLRVALGEVERTPLVTRVSTSP